MAVASFIILGDHQDPFIWILFSDIDTIFQHHNTHPLNLRFAMDWNKSIPVNFKHTFGHLVSPAPLTTCERMKGAFFRSQWLRCALFVEFWNIIPRRCLFLCVYPVYVYWRYLVSGHLTSSMQFEGMCSIHKQTSKIST